MKIIKHYLLASLIGLTGTYTYSMQPLAEFFQHPLFQETMGLFTEITNALTPIDHINMDTLTPGQRAQLENRCNLFLQQIQSLVQRMDTMPRPNNDTLLHAHSFLHIVLQSQRIWTRNILLRLSLFNHPNL